MLAALLISGWAERGNAAAGSPSSPADYPAAGLASTVPPVTDTPAARLYREKCGVCHQVWGDFPGSGVEFLQRTRGPAAAMLDARTDLQPDYIRSVARTGLMVMPPITRAEVSDAQLEEIIDYLTASGPAFQRLQ
jgi:mono/diheme cytochrome c family protein